MHTLSEIQRDARDALQIVDSFSRALTLAGFYSNGAVSLAADYIDQHVRDDEPERDPTIDAFVALLRRYAVEDCNGKVPGDEGYAGNG